MNASRRTSASIALTVGALCGYVVVGCGDRSTDARDGQPDLAPVATDPRPAATGAPAPEGAGSGEDCIRGGTPRDEVRRILGDPDSVSFGSWLYGESEIMFGYGVVVEIRNDGGYLDVC